MTISPDQLQQLQIALTHILDHQENLQSALINKTQPNTNPDNIAQSWLPVHYGVNMLDNIIEECVEAKRLIKARKWWTNRQSLVTNINELEDPDTEVRQELVRELNDVFVQFLNTLVWLNIDSMEFVNHLQAKLLENDPSQTQATIGNRS